MFQAGGSSRASPQSSVQRVGCGQAGGNVANSVCKSRAYGIRAQRRRRNCRNRVHGENGEF